MTHQKRNSDQFGGQLAVPESGKMQHSANNVLVHTALPPNVLPTLDTIFRPLQKIYIWVS
jgi:hypothetical protein